MTDSVSEERQTDCYLHQIYTSGLYRLPQCNLLILQILHAPQERKRSKVISLLYEPFCTQWTHLGTVDVF